MITVYLIAYNDEVLLPHAIKHYRARFPDAKIVVYDNFSSDLTPIIARVEGCELKYFYTSGTMDDQAILNVKNNCWKSATTDWVIVCDVDEWLDVGADDLIYASFTVVNAMVIDMVGMEDNSHDVSEVVHGVVYDHSPRKMVCFNRAKIEGIHFGYGCHTAMPVGDVRITNIFNIHHYKYISPEYIIRKNRNGGARLSLANIRKGLSVHYKHGPRQVRKKFRELRQKAIIVR